MEADERYGHDVKPEPICKCKTCRRLRTPKPLAQYLAEYIEQEVSVACMGNRITFDIPSWHELLEQALDAYESTENVKIKIEKV